MSKRRENRAHGYRMAFDFNRSLFKVLIRHLQPTPGEKILDVGCSRGFYMQAMAVYAVDVIGIDSSEVSVMDAVSDRVELGDATSLRFADETFDKVFSLHTIEHLPDPGKLISEIGRVLKPGGVAIIVYPWELFRGMQAIGAAVRLYRNPLLAGRVHLHRLTPTVVRAFLPGSPLIHRESRLVPALGLQFMTILDKPR
ncbi:MAG: class I SAM-dependent methyltransferase [Acidimicrobiia bacterium]